MDDPASALNDELLAAIRRVSGGDLDTPVPVDGDAPETLAASFNEMLVELRHRDRLLREASTRIASASDSRRRRAERELHDGVQQHLALIGLRLALLKDLIRGDPDGAQEMCDELNGSLQAAMRELRTLAYWIYPAVLENEGVAAALRDAAERIAVPTRFELDGTTRYASEVEASVYFCCLEGLQNAAKHAGESAHATIIIAEHDGELVFEVSDDGAGFERSAEALRAGLQHITDRVEALNGELSVSSAPGQGTRLRGAIPLGQRGASPDATGRRPEP
jgi:signal transduction histidine kinase